ncbi:hypothetical protein VTO42DRAFT_6125 [Malbranchea cinnamomea]
MGSRLKMSFNEQIHYSSSLFPRLASWKKNVSAENWPLRKTSFPLRSQTSGTPLHPPQATFNRKPALYGVIEDLSEPMATHEATWGQQIGQTP